MRGLFTGQLSQRGPPPSHTHTHTVNSLSRGGGVHKELKLCDINTPSPSPRSQLVCVCVCVAPLPPSLTHTQTNRASLHVSDNQNYRQNMNASRPITPEEDVHSRHGDIITLLLNRAAQQGEPMSYLDPDRCLQRAGPQRNLYTAAPARSRLRSAGFHIKRHTGVAVHPFSPMTVACRRP